MTNEEKLEFILNAINSLYKKNIKEISPEISLTDFDLNSLDIVELQMYYEDVTGLEIESSNSPITVGELMDLMK